MQAESVWVSSVLVLLGFFLQNSAEATEPTFVLPHRGCYYSVWSNYRPGKARFLPRHVDASLCTIFYYAFAEIKLDTSSDSGVSSAILPKSTFGFLTKPGGSAFKNVSLTVADSAKELLYLKRKNPALKMVVSVGGWGTAKQFSDVAASADLRKYFISSAVSLIRSLGYDGLDLSWEFPSKVDFNYFTNLITEIRAAFDAEAKTSALPRLILTAAVGNTTREGYNIPLMTQTLDLVNLMTYNLQTPSSEPTETGHPSQLFPPYANSTLVNVKDFSEAWEKAGVPKSKLVVGLAAFGDTWKLVDGNKFGLNVSAAGAGTAGFYTSSPGFLAYYEICEKIRAGELVPVAQVDIKTPYAYSRPGKWWVGYEDEVSIREKVKWTKSKGYSGVFMWDITFDDFFGGCGIKYPLLNAIKSEYKQ